MLNFNQALKHKLIIKWCLNIIAQKQLKLYFISQILGVLNCNKDLFSHIAASLFEVSHFLWLKLKLFMVGKSGLPWNTAENNIQQETGRSNIFDKLVHPESFA
jgi:hypothetical protein